MSETQVIAQSSNAVAKKTSADEIEFIPLGTDEKIKLSVAIVTNMIAVPTRSGKFPSRNDAIKFMMLCRARHLNPFEGDAFLLGYDTQDGPQFSLITAHQVFLKRAEANDNFAGMESGVIVETSEGKITEREGDLVIKGETLIGGWAKAFRRDREKPTYRRLSLSVYSTGRSRWSKDPAGMIVKCAEADALRSAFPTHLGGLYSSEENSRGDLITSSPAITVVDQTPMIVDRREQPETVGAVDALDESPDVDKAEAGRIYAWEKKTKGWSREQTNSWWADMRSQMSAEDILVITRKDMAKEEPESQEQAKAEESGDQPQAKPQRNDNGTRTRNVEKY